MNSTVLRSNFDICRSKNCDGSSPVDSKNIYFCCELRTALARTVIDRNSHTAKLDVCIGKFELRPLFTTVNFCEMGFFLLITSAAHVQVYWVWNEILEPPLALNMLSNNTISLSRSLPSEIQDRSSRRGNATNNLLIYRWP